ncbi:hypothetical protein [Candidatus Solirubrobacter pratensis]|uniref:hypothetical protein n=1 Tax=Candidatus Solirubrobacter pratensis TaxID=1298857 RepID=UPI00040290C2|nr:hypothetical protein [Candidatus Solirubrobacter pratensis]
MLRKHLSPALLVAIAALVVALGGTSYAVSRLPKNSVGSAQLKKNAVTSAKVKAGAITGAKLAPESFTGRQIVESSLGKVVSAQTADRSLAADHAGATIALDRVIFRGANGSVAQAPVGLSTASDLVTVGCDAGQLASGGGVRVDDPAHTDIIDSFPSGGGRTWSAQVRNDDETAAHTFSVFAVCVPAGAAG